MTRITNFGRKKTYLKAGFVDGGGGGGGGGGGTDVDNNEQIDHGESLPGPSSANESNPIKKPRKRRKKAKDTDDAVGKADDEENNGKSSVENSKKQEDSSKHSDDKGKKVKSGLKRERMNKKYDGAISSELRRLKRMTDRNANITCLRCRQKGHTVKTCSQAELSQLESNEEENVKPKSALAVGICYRCGSRRHNLSRCKKPTDPDNPLPFASCFVCSKTGHLASTCPQNAGKGVYPNGGSCKLCKQTSHLAKDCPLKTRVSQNTLMLGDVQTEGGADEDDFHVIKRRRNALQKEETITKKLGDKADYIHKKANPKVVVFK
ncbi:hypothetical protein Clacol_000442 [Clathrus columnatus]|uniref:CCHC-type domain-containing protein n=1 Tax=Clathrus columnatus TaxID=1419009 RepID=A0AAV4ZZQ1_9AGAM|nr:hypothetical protein Clacol_000442 [Clathrus columnatus]